MNMYLYDGDPPGPRNDRIYLFFDFDVFEKRVHIVWKCPHAHFFSTYAFFLRSGPSVCPHFRTLVKSKIGYVGCKKRGGLARAASY